MSNRRRAASFSDDDDNMGYHKRRRRNNDNLKTDQRLESLIVHLGEKSESSLENNIEGIASVVEADLHNCKNKIMKIFIKCVTELPEKLTIYTTLVGLLNVKQYSVASEFLEFLIRTFKECLKDGKFENGRMIIRFISDLVNCNVVSAASLITLYNNLMDAAYDEDSTQIRSDWYCYCVMSSLPWVARYLNESLPADFEKILVYIEKYLSERKKEFLNFIQVWPVNKVHMQEEYLDCLWAQLMTMKENGWKERHILKPYVSFDDILWGADRRGAHSLHQLTPSIQRENKNFPIPMAIFRLFDYTDCPEEHGFVLPGSHSIERFLFEEQIKFLIIKYASERKECATALLNIDLRHGIPVNYVIVEVIFGELFKLPKPKYLEVFYGSLFIELCKQQPTSFPQVDTSRGHSLLMSFERSLTAHRLFILTAAVKLAQASELLFDRLDTMTATAISRFVDWFSYHLSNFQYRWSWDDWKDCVLEEDPLNKQTTFIREVLLKCMRLSYHQRVIDMIPEFLMPLLPVKSCSYNKFDINKSIPGAMTALRLTEAIKSKQTKTEELLQILRDIPDSPMEDQTMKCANPLRIDIFIHTLLSLSSKSFSHTLAGIMKFKAALKSLSQDEPSEIQILNSIHEVWSTHHQIISLIIVKLMKMKIISPSAFATWVFSPSMTTDFTCFYIWELVMNVLSMMQHTVDKYNNNLFEAKDIFEEQQLREDDGYVVDRENAPTEEQIYKIEQDLDNARAEQKNIFLIIFQKFIILLSEHIMKLEAENKDAENSWFRWTIERLQQVFLMHHEVVYQHRRLLKDMMFTSTIDNRITRVFSEFCALKY